MFLDGGYDSGLKLPVFLLRQKEGLIWYLLWGSKECLTCYALQGEYGTWICSVLTVDSFTVLDLYLRSCFDPFVLFLIFILPV